MPHGRYAGHSVDVKMLDLSPFFVHEPKYGVARVREL